MGILTSENYQAEEVRETSWWILVVFYTGHILFLILYNTIPWFDQVIQFVEKSTGGIINNTLVFSLLAFLFLVVGVVFLMGHLQLKDVGLHRRGLLSGIGALAIVWVAGIIYQLFVSGMVAPIAFWQDNKTAIIVGQLIAQLFGNALFEETAYRGFIFLQLQKKLQYRFSQKQTLVGAGILSAVLFALMHLPVLWLYGASVSDMLMKLLVTFIGGIIWALLFHRTGNLFFVIGIHAFLNIPASIFISNGASVIITLMLAILFAFKYQRLLVPTSPYSMSLKV